MTRHPWIQTYTGKQFWPLDPQVEDICIEDIAHHLSLLCRFNGACQPFYSVAEHCIRLSRIVRGELALFGLLHDAPEAYLGDQVKPIKARILIRQVGTKSREGPIIPICTFHDRLMRTIATRFGFADQLEDSFANEQIKRADARMLVTEARDLMSAAPAPWATPPGTESLRLTIAPWSAAIAEEVFLTRFEGLNIDAARQPKSVRNPEPIGDRL